MDEPKLPAGQVADFRMSEVTDNNISADRLIEFMEAACHHGEPDRLTMHRATLARLRSQGHIDLIGRVFFFYGLPVKMLPLNLEKFSRYERRIHIRDKQGQDLMILREGRLDPDRDKAAS